MERRLTAILAADVVGFSRLMGVDEVATLAALNGHRRDLIDGKFAEHQGRIVKLTGDGILAEFASVVNALACAVDIQRGMMARNETVPHERRLEFRIGINLGDVIVEGADIFGDGVNVAARLEGIAKPGGITVSAVVRDQVGDRLALTFEDMGEQALKNIERPVRAYNVALAAAAAKPALPDKPSIAVLPFTNMSGDPEQEYFSDGISEDIITDLSKIAGLMVIARNSSFAYKGKNPDIRQVGRELGVRAVLEGSIRKAGNRVRITAQLIDAANGAHLWAERFDRDLTDIFAVQDEVTKHIVEALKVSLRPAEKALLAENRTSSTEAHDWFLRGRELLRGSIKNREVFEQMVAAFSRSIECDPDYAEPHAGLALSYVQEFHNNWGGTADALGVAARYAALALAKGPNDPYSHYGASVVTMFQRKFDDAIAHIEAIQALSPNYALGYSTRGMIETFRGNPLAGLPYTELSIKLDPGFKHQYLHFQGMLYLVAGDYRAAVTAFRARIKLVPESDLSRSFLASALGHLGEFDEARRIWRELMEINPKYTIAAHLARLPFQNQADADRIIEGLAKAGLAVG